MTVNQVIVAWLQNGLTVLIAVATLLTAIATFRIVREMKVQREQSNKPFLELVVPDPAHYAYHANTHSMLLGSLDVSHQDNYSYYLHDIKCAEVVNLSGSAARKLIVNWKVLSPSVDHVIERCVKLKNVNANYDSGASALSTKYYRGAVFHETSVPLSERGSGCIVIEPGGTPVDFCLPSGSSAQRFFVELPESMMNYILLCLAYYDESVGLSTRDAIEVCALQVDLYYSSVGGSSDESSFELRVCGHYPHLLYRAIRKV